MENQKTPTLKNNLKKIPIEYFKKNLPDLKNAKEAKAAAIGKWLAKSIAEGLKNKELAVSQLLPTKAEFAYNLGVSIGTIQNALKFCDDYGFTEAKPCVGTVIKDKNSPQIFNQKSVSKQDTIVFEIKKYIKSEKFKIGDNISSPKNISEKIKRPVNSVRQALESMCTEGILKHIYRNEKGQTGWYLVSDKFDKNQIIPEGQTLVEKIVNELKEYISKNYNKGEKIRSHAEFSKILNASMSTIHTAFETLGKEGIIKTRRGQYGTIIVRMPNEKYELKPEMSIFAPAAEAVVYYYEKVQAQIKKMISQNYEIGDKLPSIVKIAKTLDISPNTVRKALVKISEEGYVKSNRGRYGGTFVTDLPEAEGQNFRWLAVNPKYAIKETGKN